MCKLFTVKVLIPLHLSIQDAWDRYVINSDQKIRNQADYTTKINYKDIEFLKWVIWRLIIFVFIICLFNSSRILNISQNLNAIALLGLALILLIANPSLFLSRQVTNLRWIFRMFREDKIRTLVSPGIYSTNFLTIVIQKIVNYLQKNKNWLLFICILIFCLIVLPIFLIQNNLEENILNLIKIGTISLFLLSIAYGVFLLIQKRPRHIVLPFLAVKPNTDHQLEVVANLIRQAFVDQLHQISFLLNLRQVENLGFRDDSGLAVFVASGGNSSIAEQLRSLGNFEFSDIKIPFGNYIGTLIQQWAETQVRGTVQRQENNSIAIWVEYILKNEQTIGVDLVILPENSVQENDGIEINKIAYTLAIKLVLKLGHHSHIATSFESMRYFLDGLKASYQRQWWLAISHFHKAVHIEEAEKSSFGYGFYHLGALLMSQGNIYKGQTYLEHAEASGPPLAETQYMLALGLYYLYQDQLHFNRTVFTDIEYKCRAALSLRPNFPEVFHLLGSAYYQRGRLRERAETRNSNKKIKSSSYKKIDPIPRHYANDYYMAKEQLLKAIKQYDKAIRNLPNDANAKATLFNEQARLVEDRMAATHRVGDVFRSLTMYAEADRYYKDVRIAFPRNNRTLIDISKTYCFAKNWGRADEFLRNDVFNYPELKWDKSASLYMAWAQLGGISENGNRIKKYVDRLFISSYERYANQLEKEEQKKQFPKIIWNAVSWLDFSLHQYPSYLYRWHQLDWQPILIKAINFIGGKSIFHEDPQKIYQDSINFSKNKEYLLQYWIAWRILGIDFGNGDDKSILEIASRIVGNQFDQYDQNSEIHPFANEFPNTQFKDCFIKLQDIRSAYVEILNEDDRFSRIKSLNRRFSRLRLGIDSYWYWKEIYKSTFTEEINSDNKNFVEILEESRANISFSVRWAIDVFVEYSLITIKLLTEGKAFELAREVSSCSSEILEKFMNIANIDSVDKEIMFLGGKVANYQLSMLYAWEVYANLMIRNDVATQARKDINSFILGLDENLRKIELALSINNHNPLAVFTKSILDKERGLHHQAADGLARLIKIVAPFNPHKYIRRRLDPSEGVRKDKSTNQSNGSLSAQLSFKERVHGRRQIENIVNLTNIHYELATIYTHLKEYQLVATHLNHAVSYSVYNDISAELFLNLSILLTKEEKFQEALAASDEAKDLHMYLSRFENKSSNCMEPFILECTLQTSLENYSLSLEKSAQIQLELSDTEFESQHRKLIKEVKETYKGAESHIVEYEKEFNSFIREWNEKFFSVASGDNSSNATGYLSKAAQYCLDPKLLSKLIKVNEINSPLDQLIFIFSSQLIAQLSRDLFDYQVYCCDIQNTMAFNWSELNFNLELAFEYTDQAVNKMLDLYRASFEVNDKDESFFKDEKTNFTTEKSSIRTKMFDPFTEAITRYDERLANYLDTRAWVQVKLGIDNSIKGQISDNNEHYKEYLQDAYLMLSDRALEYGPHLPVIYYHLSRICVNKIEHSWQSISAQRDKNNLVPSEKALKISMLLRTAILYLRQAAKLNHSGSLQVRIRRVEERLTKYRKEWDELYEPRNIVHLDKSN